MQPYVVCLELFRVPKSRSHEKRIAAIAMACAEFDHTDEQRHNKELELGAALALTQITMDIADEREVRMVCSAIEMVFRAGSQHIHAAFETCGSELLEKLLQITHRAEAGKMKSAGMY